MGAVARLVGVWMAACALGCGAGARTAISLDGERFRVTGLDPAEIVRLAEARWGPEEWSRIFAVYVASGQGGLPLFGDHRVEGGDLIFVPRFPLKEGLEYRALLASAGTTIERSFSLPAAPPAAPAAVRHVYPSRPTLPENLLKFYLHFSAPMARGEAYRRIHLVGSGGQEVDMPFLELGEELWDRAGTRLTLFFDPGRIKRGLKPREEAGPTLEEGKSYTLVIDREWSDAAGRTLQQGYRKAFKVAAPDEKQPDPKDWKFQPPRAGTKDPLTVLFDEPLDEAMLNRALAVLDRENRPVAGRVEVDQEETRWRFRPDAAWQAGKHFLVVDTVLEDLAGNSVGRPFEIDVFRPVERLISAKTVSLPFEVAARE